MVTNLHYEQSTVPYNSEDKVMKQNPLVVQTKIEINTVSDIIMSEQLVSTNMKVMLAWEDPGLGACRCHNQEEGGENEDRAELTLGADVEDLIWEPDLTGWNYRKFERETGMGGKKHSYLYFSKIKNGKAGLMVELEVHIYTTVSCDFDVSKFPYDVNSCYIRLGSYLHGRDEVVFNTTAVTVQDGQNLRAGKFKIELLHLPDTKSFDKYEDEIKSLFGFSIKIKRNGARVESQYTQMMGSVIFLTLCSFLLDVMDEDENLVDRGGLLGGGILCTVLVFQYTVQYTPTSEELIMNPVVRYNLLCLAVCALCMIQWCLLGSNRVVSFLYSWVPSILRVSGEATSEEEELKRARVICDVFCFVFIGIVFYICSYLFFRVEE